MAGIGILSSEPITPIGDPPAGKDYRDGRGQRPPEGKHNVSEQAQRGKSYPEDFAFHSISLFRCTAEAASQK
jgi:hypothetical protein